MSWSDALGAFGDIKIGNTTLKGATDRIEADYSEGTEAWNDMLASGKATFTGGRTEDTDKSGHANQKLEKGEVKTYKAKNQDLEDAQKEIKSVNDTKASTRELEIEPSEDSSKAESSSNTDSVAKDDSSKTSEQKEEASSEYTPPEGNMPEPLPTTTEEAEGSSDTEAAGETLETVPGNSFKVEDASKKEPTGNLLLSHHLRVPTFTQGNYETLQQPAVEVPISTIYNKDLFSLMINKYLGGKVVNGITIEDFHTTAKAFMRTTNPLTTTQFTFIARKAKEGNWQAFDFRLRSVKLPEFVRNSADAYYGDTSVSIPINNMTFEKSFDSKIMLDRKGLILKKFLQSFGYREISSGVYDLNSLNLFKPITFAEAVLMVSPGWIYHTLYQADSENPVYDKMYMHNGSSYQEEAELETYPMYKFENLRFNSMKWDLNFDSSNSKAWEIDTSLTFSNFYKIANKDVYDNLAFALKLQNSASDLSSIL